jgi:hypothetical protein
MPGHRNQSGPVQAKPGDRTDTGGKQRGRPKGAKGVRTLVLEATFQATTAGLPRDFTSLTLLQAVYRDPALPPEMRLAAAVRSLPYEHHRLAAIVHTGTLSRRYEDLLAELDDPDGEEDSPAAAGRPLPVRRPLPADPHQDGEDRAVPAQPRPTLPARKA